MEFMRHSGPDHRTGISFLLTNQAVEQKKPKSREPPVQSFNRSDHLSSPLSLPVNPSVAEDSKPIFPTIVLDRMKDLCVYASRGFKTVDSVFLLYPAAHSFGIPEKYIILSDDFFFSFMPFQEEIEVLSLRSELFKLQKERIFTAETNIKGFFQQRRKGLSPAFESQPTRRITLRMEEHEFMIPASQSIPDLDIPPHTSKYLDMGKESSDFHLGRT